MSAASPTTARRFDKALLSGQVLAGIIHLAYSSTTSALRMPIFGHIERRTATTDASSSVETASVVVTSVGHAVAPSGSAEGDACVGAVSCRKAADHELSFADFQASIAAEGKALASGFAPLLLLVTQRNTTGLDAIEYSLFQGRQMVPIEVGNIVDSTGEFAVLKDTFCRNRPSFAIPATTAGPAGPAPPLSAYCDACIAALRSSATAYAELYRNSVELQRSIDQARERVARKRRQLEGAAAS